MGEVVQLRDYQTASAIERARKALEDHLNHQAIEIANMAFPSVFGFSNGIDGMGYVAPEKDPA